MCFLFGVLSGTAVHAHILLEDGVGVAESTPSLQMGRDTNVREVTPRADSALNGTVNLLAGCREWDVADVERPQVHGLGLVYDRQ